MRGNFTARPIKRDEAREFIARLHRHHGVPAGWKFGIAAYQGDRLVGVVTVGRPVARMLDDGETCEVTRLCTDGTQEACSFLYGRARRCAFEMGYKRIITYILDSEPGSSLKGAGWQFVRETKGGSWDRPSRRRTDKAPTVKKQLWQSVA